MTLLTPWEAEGTTRWSQVVMWWDLTLVGLVVCARDGKWEPVIWGVWESHFFAFCIFAKLNYIWFRMYYGFVECLESRYIMYFAATVAFESIMIKMNYGLIFYHIALGFLLLFCNLWILFLDIFKDILNIIWFFRLTNTSVKYLNSPLIFFS